MSSTFGIIRMHAFLLRFFQIRTVDTCSRDNNLRYCAYLMYQFWKLIGRMNG